MTGVIKVKRFSRSWSRKKWPHRKTQHCWLWRWRERASSQGVQAPPGAGRGWTVSCSQQKARPAPTNWPQTASCTKLESVFLFTILKGSITERARMNVSVKKECKQSHNVKIEWKWDRWRLTGVLHREVPTTNNTAETSVCLLSPNLNDYYHYGFLQGSGNTLQQ